MAARPPKGESSLAQWGVRTSILVTPQIFTARVRWEFSLLLFAFFLPRNALLVRNAQRIGCPLCTPVHFSMSGVVHGGSIPLSFLQWKSWGLLPYFPFSETCHVPTWGSPIVTIFYLNPRTILFFSLPLHSSRPCYHLQELPALLFSNFLHPSIMPNLSSSLFQWRPKNTSHFSYSGLRSFR